ncbi:MAG: chemotaxis protein CheW [Actinomycetes bacterium]
MTGVDISDGTREQVLRARAANLARRAEGSVAGDSLRVLDFGIRTERYACQTALVEEVLIMRDLAPIPGTPGYVLGITSVRGRIVAVLDLHLLLGSTPTQIAQACPIIVLRSATMEFAVAAESIGEVRQVPEASVQVGVGDIAGVREEYLLGVTTGGIMILDAAKMLADPRLVVGDVRTQATPQKGSTA